MRSLLISGLLAATTLLAACGTDDDGDVTDDTTAATAASSGDSGVTDQTDSETSTDGDAGGGASDESDGGEAADDAGDDAAPSGGSGSGSAVLTLANGETYEFSVLCSLEPQMAAGSEILFTATSYDDPGLDITQFGDEGTVTGLATVSVYDASFETLWDAGSVYEAFGGSLELTLEGSTIRGVGSFYPNADPAAAPVDGEVVANC